MEVFADALGAGLGALVVVYLVMMLFVAAWGIVSYVFTSLGFYSMAKRRGINNPWLAWIPVGNYWIAGSISDQYQQVAKGKDTRRRTILLILALSGYALAIISSGASVAQIMSVIMADHGYNSYGTGMAAYGLMGLMSSGLSIASSVVYYFCLYDLYASAKPENAVLYIVLSILVGVATPFLIFSCRIHDLGMVPPPQPQYYSPVYGQQPTAPTWQNTQQTDTPPANPWDQNRQ